MLGLSLFSFTFILLFNVFFLRSSESGSLGKGRMSTGKLGAESPLEIQIDMPQITINKSIVI